MQNINIRPAMVEKQKQIDLINNHITSAKATIVVQYQGLNVEEISALRKELKSKGAILAIYKNNLVARALEKSKYKTLENALVGPNAFIFGFENDLEIAKIVSIFAKNNKMLVLKGGIFEGKVVDKDELVTITTLPSKLELISMFAATLQAPIINFALAVKAISEKIST